jgi:hypothetical protein
MRNPKLNDEKRQQSARRASDPDAVKEPDVDQRNSFLGSHGNEAKGLSLGAGTVAIVIVGAFGAA